jgi:hypothetical protein
VELTIREGQVIENVTTDESGWWKGTLNGHTGLFPHNFVVAIDAAAAQEALARSESLPLVHRLPPMAPRLARRPLRRVPRAKTPPPGQGVNVLAAVGGMSELQAKLEAQEEGLSEARRAASHSRRRRQSEPTRRRNTEQRQQQQQRQRSFAQ